MKSARERCPAGARDLPPAVIGTRAAQAGFSSAGVSFPVCSGRLLLIIDNQVRLYCHVLGRSVRSDSIFRKRHAGSRPKPFWRLPKVVSSTLMNFVESFLVNKRALSREPLH
jgi:hypothetical protein